MKDIFGKSEAITRTLEKMERQQQEWKSLQSLTPEQSKLVKERIAAYDAITNMMRRTLKDLS